MSKIAHYLSEHIQGEVVTSPAVRDAFSNDASVLSIRPEMVAFPRVTNDIRKIARFSWQLAEKGHVLPMTVRGAGTDQTGAAIGKGIIVNTVAHLDSIFELDAKQKLVRVQPGVTFKTLNDALGLQGLFIPSLPASHAYSTIGGAIANNASGSLSGKYGDTGAWVSQLEIVLANGDILQTGRISKKEVNRKKGLQSLEGEIYRQIDNLITDNHQVITGKISADVRDNAGYTGIIDVRHKDGSIDLTPLLLGSQGTLGIVSEIIMKATFANRHHYAVVAAFEQYESCRDAIDDIVALDPAICELVDGSLIAEAVKQGRNYSFFTPELATGAALVIAFDEYSERGRSHKLKKAVRQLELRGATVVSETDEVEVEALLDIRKLTSMQLAPSERDASAPPIIDGAYVPLNRLEDFHKAVVQLAKKHHVALPLFGHAIEGVFYARPILHMKKVSDKQKIFKLLGEYSVIVDSHGGHLVGEAGEGRLKPLFAYKYIDDEVMAVFKQIKDIFDPYGILNPGVKQATELKDLVGHLREDYSLAAFSQYSPHC